MQTRSSTPEACPECGSSPRPIVYGEPTMQGYEAADRDEVVLGGNVVLGDPPIWDCGDCGHRW